jgi:tRNA(fMet)-specific endonuclease VapC
LKYVLDTNLVSEAMRGNASVLQRLTTLAPGAAGVSSVTCAEIEYGIGRLSVGSRPTVRQRELRELFEALASYVQVLSWDRVAAGCYARGRLDCESAGLSVDHIDLMIAAHAKAEACILVTADKALVRAAKLRAMPPVENWLASPH